MQTTEGEQIAQLIAGYIDIILKKASSGKGSLLFSWEKCKVQGASWAHGSAGDRWGYPMGFPSLGSSMEAVSCGLTQCIFSLP